MTMFVSAQHVLEQHPHATVLTIDFFDTLVTRSVAQPTHAFAVMEEELCRRFGRRWSGFAIQRVSAEHEARKKAAKTNRHRDINFAEIMNELSATMNLDNHEREIVVELETMTEVSLAAVVRFGADVAEYAISRGMQVLVVSDNYMSAQHIVNMAHAAGLAWVQESNVIVSSEHGAMKHNGTLWDVVLNHLHVDPAFVLHVGDDAIADGEFPASRGISTHINNHMRRSHRHMMNTSPAVLPFSRMETYARDAMAGKDWDAAQTLSALVAMIVAAQIVDVRSVLSERDVVGVHFVARDGFLAHSVWKKLRATGSDLPEATYFSFSRSVVWRAGIQTVDESTMARFIGDDEELSISRLERRIGCELHSTIDPSSTITAVVARQILVANAENILAASAQLRARMLGYLETQGLLQHGHHVVVDLGWTGSSIADLAQIVSDATNGQAVIEGRLTGLYWDAWSQRTRVALHGFAMDDFHTVDDNLRLLGILKLLEVVVTAPHGSVVGYGDAESGYAPQYVTTEVELDAYSKVVRRISELAAQAAEEILNGVHPSGVDSSDISGASLWAAMMQIGHTPHAEEIALVAELRHISAIDHEGAGATLICEAPRRTRKWNDDSVRDLFDVLMHGHWLQGTLRDWRSESDSAALVQDIERLFPFTHPQWAHA
jgi:FMN phosphatase YigB (HAD superfamily)